jgi:hypothetical protein
MEQPTAGTVAETNFPATSDAAFSLKAYRKGETSSETPTAEAKPAVEAPVVDDDVDPETQAEVDKIEPPTDHETPAEKAARTRKHKEAARKGFQTRQANKLTRLERENQELRQRLTAPAGEPARPASAPRPAATAEPSTDPKPTFDTWAAKNTFEAFAAANPNHPDPYLGWKAAFDDERDAWKERDAARRDRVTQTERQQQEARKRYDDLADPLRAKHADYDAKVTDMAQAIAGTWVDDAVGEFTKSSKVGGEVLYRLASDPAATRKALAEGPIRFGAYLVGLEKEFTAAAEKPAAPVVSAAPAPHQPVAAASTGTPVNPASKPGSALSLREMREWEAKHGKRRS